MLVIPKSALLLFLADTVAGELAAAVVHLYKNDLVPTPNTILADLISADYSGYATKVLGTAGAPIINSDGAAQVVYPSQQWQHSSGATANTIYGAYVLDAGGALLYVERFGTPVNMTDATDGFIYVPVFTNSSAV